MTLLFPGFQRQAKRKISVKDILIDRKLIPAPPIQETAHVDIHGSGTAVQKAVKLALAVQARSGGEVKMSSVKTSSEQVVDDMLLISTGGDKEDDEETKMRTISTIHIRLQREQK
jgi:DNA-binding protein